MLMRKPCLCDIKMVPSNPETHFMFSYYLQSLFTYPAGRPPRFLLTFINICSVKYPTLWTMPYIGSMTGNSTLSERNPAGNSEDTHPYTVAKNVLNYDRWWRWTSLRIQRAFPEYTFETKFSFDISNQVLIANLFPVFLFLFPSLRSHGEIVLEALSSI